MRVQGHNALAILVAAIAIYAIEFLIFAIAIEPAQFAAMAGMTPEQIAAGAARMPYGAIMPLLTAIGVSLVIKWRGASGAFSGAFAAALIGVLLAFSARMYGYVYGQDSEAYLLIDLGRFALTYGMAGAILGAWK